MSKKTFEEVSETAGDMLDEFTDLVNGLEGLEPSYDIAFKVIDTLRSYIASGQKTVGMVKMLQSLKAGFSGVGKFFGKGE